jgi:hypothetical protein
MAARILTSLPTTPVAKADTPDIPVCRKELVLRRLDRSQGNPTGNTVILPRVHIIAGEFGGADRTLQYPVQRNAAVETRISTIVTARGARGVANADTPDSFAVPETANVARVDQVRRRMTQWCARVMVTVP